MVQFKSKFFLKILRFHSSDCFKQWQDQRLLGLVHFLLIVKTHIERQKSGRKVPYENKPAGPGGGATA